MRVGARKGNSDVRLWPLADCHFSVFQAYRTSAIRPKADIRLVLVERSANDPKRTFLTARHKVNNQEISGAKEYKETTINNKAKPA